MSANNLLGDFAFFPDSALWLRSDIGITPGVGSGVASWAGVGGGPVVSQATAGMQPVFNASDAVFDGLPSLAFASASTQYMFAANTPLYTNTGYSYVVVSTRSVSGGAGVVFGVGEPANGSVIGFQAIPQLSITAPNCGTFLYDGSPPINTASIIVVTQGYSASDVPNMWLNGTLLVESSYPGKPYVPPGPSASVCVGTYLILGDYTLDGSVAEVLVFPFVLDDNRRRSIERYLSTRYNIPVQ